jgi:vacuole morphology and inheritance protein 14
MNVHFRKGGLIGLAATAIGLNPQQLTSAYLEFLIKPVLICFDDPEPRVRYYACESLYNVVKVARESVLPYFNIIFEGVATVLADTDDEVRDGASLLDRLVKDIVTESEAFSVEKFLPLLQNYIRRTNPYLRQLVVGWITVLDGIPDVCMLDYLPDFLDGLFNMLSDSNLEIRQAADSALSDFLREIRESAVVEFGPIVSILVFQCESKERLNRLTSITWLSELIHHPDSGGDALLPYHADVLGAILHCISDQEVEIRKVSERSNSDLLTFVRDTDRDFELRILLETLTKELTGKDDVPTKMAVLKWINMLLEKRRRDMDEYISKLMPALLQLLSDQSDGVVLLTVQVLSRISLSEVVIQGSASKEKVRDEDQFEMVIKSILELFKADRRLLETRSSLIVRRLCVLLNAKSVYLVMADIISSYDLSPESGDSNTLEFVATMVQTLNLILLTASELNNLRQLLEESFSGEAPEISSSSSISKASAGRYQAKNEGARVFAALFHCWSNNPVSTFSLCLLARAYDLAFALVKKFSELEVTVGLLMQLDRLIGLIESPIFVHIRLQLLDVEAPFHTYLLKSCYGLLMLLPQSDAYRSLNDRLTSVCNLRDNLGVRPSITAAPSTGVIKNEESSIYNAGLDAVDLLDRFDEVMAIHRKARSAIQQKSIMHQQQDHINERNSTVGNVLRVAIVNTPSSRPPDQMPIGMGPSMRQR